MSPRANRTAPRLMFLAGGLLLAGLLLTACGSESISGEQRAFDLDGGTLVIEADQSEVELVPDDGVSGEVHVTRWFEANQFLGRSDTDWEMRDGHVLALTTSCRGALTNCEARHEIRVPSALDVTVENRNGTVRAGGLTGSLTVTTRNGAIEVDGHEGPVEFESRNGRVDATGLLADHVAADTRNGDIHLALADAAESVETESRNGGTTIEVPGDRAYRVATETNNGRVTVEVPQTGSADGTGSDSDPRIDAISRNGPITVRATD